METEVEEKEQTPKLEIQEEESPSKLLFRFPVGSQKLSKGSEYASKIYICDWVEE